MISRIWHGYTTPENADAYEALLKEEVFVGILNRNISGYKGIQLLRRQISDETEFITIMWFDSLDSVLILQILPLQADYAINKSDILQIL